MSIVHSEIRDSIDKLVANADIVQLYLHWTEQAPGDGLPGETAFTEAALPLFWRHLMVLRPEGPDYRYEHYGQGIAAQSGFDMAGRLTSDFNSEVGRFFHEKYDDCLVYGRPVYTVHRASHAKAIHSWERLMLPVQGLDGQPYIVCYNRPLDLKAELFDSLMSASFDGIFILGPLVDDDGEVRDFAYQAVNRHACELLARAETDLVGKGLGEVFPDAGTQKFEIFLRTYRSGTPDRFELRTALPSGARNLRFSVACSHGKLIVICSDITELRQTQESLEQQATELSFANEALESQAKELAKLAEDRELLLQRNEKDRSFITTLLQTVPIPIYARDAEHRTTHANLAYLDLVGRPEEEVLGKAIHEIHDKETAQEVLELNLQLVEEPSGKQVYERRIENPGRHRDIVVHNAAIRDAQGISQGLVGAIIDVTEERALRAELELLAATDSLTGAANRRSFLQTAEREIKRCLRYDHPLSVIMIDLDKFKAINDTYGHQAGDEVLKRMSEVCRAAMRDPLDMLARLGGEEFALLVPETGVENASVLAERLRRLLAEQAVIVDGAEISFTASLGVAAFDEKSDANIDDVLKRADECLYAAKEAGRNRTMIWRNAKVEGVEKLRHSA